MEPINDLCFFVSDLHGKEGRYEKLLQAVLDRNPGLVMLGGDLMPNRRLTKYADFIQEYLMVELRKVKAQMKSAYPFIGLILGNDDARIYEESAIAGEDSGLWNYIHMKRVSYGPHDIYGYSYVPPTPFLLKDWERYDVSRYVDPGSVPPTEGVRTVDIHPDEAEYCTIQKDLEEMTVAKDLSKSVFLFHAPPYQSKLDRAALDGVKYEHVPLDVHVGSIAIQRFIAERQPCVTLHGHIHESSRLTGDWKETMGATHSFSAAWDGPELALVEFRLSQPHTAVRSLL